MSFHYAVGAYGRLATEEYGAERRVDVTEYEVGPDQQEVIDDMVDNGWSTQEAEDAAEELWEVLD